MRLCTNQIKEWFYEICIKQNKKYKRHKVIFRYQGFLVPFGKCYAMDETDIHVGGSI